LSRLLAIDTTTGACSAALYEPAAGTIEAARYRAMPRGHAEALAPMVAEVMDEAGAAMRDVSRVAVTVGPGTFTGCRIGLAFARALGAALGCPVIGVSTLRAIAANVFLGGDPDAPPVASDIAALMDARRGELYLQLFAQGGAPRTAPRLIKVLDAVEELGGEGLMLAGTGADVLINAGAAPGWTRAAAPDFPDARLIARLAAAMPDPDTMPEPLYLRAPDAKLPQNKPQLRAGPAPLA